MKPTSFCPTLVILTLSLVILLGVPAGGDEGAVQPQLPHAFYGMVQVMGSNAGQGLIVEATGPGVRSNIAGNPVITKGDGTYGAVNFSSQKLIVQGNLEAGTPVEFFVGGIQAEVYDVAAGGPWKMNYSYKPGELTELNLRINSMPAAGQTREPTPVQTVVSSSGPISSTNQAPSGGSLLPQVPDSSGQLPPGGAGSGGNTQSSGGQAEATRGSDQQTTGQNPAGNPVTLPATGDTTLYAAAGIVVLLVIVGGAYYYTSRKKSGTEEKKESEKKED